MVNMGTMVGIDLIKSLVKMFFTIFDGYITGSLGPAGSQIQKMKILNNFFILRFVQQQNIRRTRNSKKILSRLRE